MQYLTNQYLYILESTIIEVGQDEKGEYVVFQDTILYPQGGGQQADKGYIELDNHTYEVSYVRTVGCKIHVYCKIEHPAINKPVKQIINDANRIQNSKLHSSGHLISNIIEELYPAYQAARGHHFNGECYVEFITKSLSGVNIEEVNKRIGETIKADLPLIVKFIPNSELKDYCPNLPYSIPSTVDEVRLVRIGHYPFQPCGGTHVKSSKELLGLNITKQKHTGLRNKISYQILVRSPSE